MIYQPYTYLIKFIPTGQLYYGSRTAKNCSPDDLWVKYFTSSKIVAGLIVDFGRESFEIVSIKLHETREDTLRWERLYLVSVDAAENIEYLNKHNGGNDFSTAGNNEPKSEEHKNNIRNALLGIKHSKERTEKQRLSLIGIKHSEEQNRIHSERFTGEGNPNFGKHLSEETKKRIGLANSGENNWNWGKFGENNLKSKFYIITFPDNHEELILGLTNFCRDYNLNHGSMASGRKSKGFKSRLATEQEILDNS